MKRHNIEFLWGWFDALRRRDTEAMTAALDPDIVWQGVRPDLVCQIVLGAHSPDLAVDEVETLGEIYNVFTIEDQKITRIEDHLERDAALAAAGVKPPTPTPPASLGHSSDVRLASSADAEPIGRLLHDFNTEFDEVTPGPRVLADRIRQLLDRGDATVILAGTGPDGLGVLRFRPAIWTDAPECYLAELYVVPQRRGQGLGRALMEAAIEVARARGAAWMELGTSEDDVAARALYESLGFSNREGRPDGPVNYFYEREL